MMKLKLKEKEWRRLLRLAFLGNYVINGCRPPRAEKEGYAALADKLYRLQYRRTYPGNGKPEPNEVADLREQVYGEVNAFLEQFEEDVRGHCGAEAALMGERFGVQPVRGVPVPADK